MPNRFRALMAAALLAASVAIAVTATPGSAGSRYTTKVVKIADGVTLLKVTDSRGPNRIRVLRVDPSKAVTIDVGLAGKTWPKYDATSTIAANYGAIGAVNGDFNGGTGHPLHPFLEDGLVATSGVNIGWMPKGSLNSSWGLKFSFLTPRLLRNLARSRLTSAGGATPAAASPWRSKPEHFSAKATVSPQMRAASMGL